MATVLAETERVRVFPDVANLPLRPPAVMAKAAFVFWPSAEPVAVQVQLFAEQIAPAVREALVL